MRIHDRCLLHRGRPGKQRRLVGQHASTLVRCRACPNRLPCRAGVCAGFLGCFCAYVTRAGANKSPVTLISLPPHNQNCIDWCERIKHQSGSITHWLHKAGTDGQTGRADCSLQAVPPTITFLTTTSSENVLASYDRSFL